MKANYHITHDLKFYDWNVCLNLWIFETNVEASCPKSNYDLTYRNMEPIEKNEEELKSFRPFLLFSCFNACSLRVTSKLTLNKKQKHFSKILDIRKFINFPISAHKKLKQWYDWCEWKRAAVNLALLLTTSNGPDSNDAAKAARQSFCSNLGFTNTDCWNSFTE